MRFPYAASFSSSVTFMPTLSFLAALLAFGSRQALGSLSVFVPVWALRAAAPRVGRCLVFSWGCSSCCSFPVFFVVPLFLSAFAGRCCSRRLAGCCPASFPSFWLLRSRCCLSGRWWSLSVVWFCALRSCAFLARPRFLLLLGLSRVLAVLRGSFPVAGAAVPRLRFPRFGRVVSCGLSCLPSFLAALALFRSSGCGWGCRPPTPKP